jgi:hypothetical protein
MSKGGSRIPAGSELRIAKELYKGDGNHPENRKNLNSILGDYGKFGVIDPRYVGHDYISYMFLSVEDQLSTGFGIGLDQLADINQHTSLFMGSCLGDFDMVFRRTANSRYDHAKFAILSKQSNIFDFASGIETYPIITLGRWHGHDVKGEKTLKDPPSLPSKIQAEIIDKIATEPDRSIEWIKEEIQRQVKNGNIDDIKESDLKDRTMDDFSDEFEEINDYIYLGESVHIDINRIQTNHHVTIGLTVEEVKDLPDDMLPNEKIMDDLMSEFDGWEMPYIMSGIGQDWADIILEMHIENISEMEDRAEIIRDIPGVTDTKTYMVTGSNFNVPFIPSRNLIVDSGNTWKS